MRRSLLFLPGNNPNMLINADYLGSDAVIFDLEDAVSPAEKDSARKINLQPPIQGLRSVSIQCFRYYDDLQREHHIHNRMEFCQ